MADRDTIRVVLVDCSRWIYDRFTGVSDDRAGGRAEETAGAARRDGSAIEWTDPRAFIRGTTTTRASGVPREPRNVISGRSVGGHPAHGLDWVIVGGESGPSARPFGLEWARSILEQCKVARVPCFVKQLSAQPTW